MFKITTQTIENMSYVDFMAFLDEKNRPPGGKDSLRRVINNTFLRKESKVLDVGCNTGYCTFEIAHSVDCQVVGVDINQNMINSAKKQLQKDTSKYKNLIDFKVDDGRGLQFENNEFDLVISGGSTAFIDNKKQALKEYKRVCKNWGFVVDINFFFHEPPPEELVEEIRKVLGIDIKVWRLEDWRNLYEDIGLEKYYIYKNKMDQVSKDRVRKYCEYMALKKDLSPEITNKIKDKLWNYMSLFNHEHKYLSYAIFIYRKRCYKEEMKLFI